MCPRLTCTVTFNSTVLAIVLDHCAVAHKRVVTLRTNAVEVSVGLVVVAVRTSAVDIPIKEFKAVSNCDETVEILCVKCKDVRTICNMVTPGSNAVVMLHLTINALVIWT